MKCQQESSFFKKKEAKKLLLLRPVVFTPARPSARKDQKFFGSFFQKRTSFA
jgi:hypothetical protein